MKLLERLGVKRKYEAMEYRPAALVVLLTRAVPDIRLEKAESALRK